MEPLLPTIKDAIPCITESLDDDINVVEDSFLTIQFQKGSWRMQWTFLLFVLLITLLASYTSCHRYGSHYYHMLTPSVGSNFNEHHQPRRTPPLSSSPSKYRQGFWNQKGLVWNNRWRSKSIVRTKKQAAEWDDVVPSLLDEVPLETLTIRWPTVNVKIGQPVFVGQMTDRPHLIWPAGMFF